MWLTVTMLDRQILRHALASVLREELGYHLEEI